MTRRSSLDRSDAIHSANRSADSATNRREPADFEVPSPAMTGISPSGSRTARLSLRVDTLISIRFMAQRPSQSSACAALQVGSATSWPSQLRTRGRCTTTLPPRKPIFPQRWPTRPPLMRRAGEPLRVLAKHLLDGSDPGRQTEALKGAVHILPSRLEAGHERER